MVRCITHRVFFFCIRKDTLNGFFALLVKIGILGSVACVIGKFQTKYSSKTNFHHPCPLLADMGRFVRAICYNGLYYGEFFGCLVIYVVKCYAIVYVAGSYYGLKDVSVLITGSRGFVGKLSLST